ncbi:MAG TPA: DEAD/DEAH box helicase [Dietzia timorensis]|uniref:DEAD/DEAH box helicase n=1 Tax=Dietzia timorensis TaxID=499555 RepID=A0A921F532_9ACTN|nr:DEAD/DEAH box helicase [Dietzia timorensis]HJE90269.1 DEAD/DEAH box helicase [Dietzia timorensis]
MDLSTRLLNDLRFGHLDRTSASEKLFNPRLVYNAEQNTMFKAIVEELRRSHAFTFSVAFVSPDAIASLKQPLVDFAGTGRIITSTYLGFNNPKAFRELANLRDLGIEVHVVDGAGRGFHPKGFLFEQPVSMTAIVGSSNLTSSALKLNHEWNLKFSALPGGDIVDQLSAAVQTQLDRAVPLTDEWIDRYEAEYVAPPPRPRGQKAAAGTDVVPAIVPNAMQAEALEQIALIRDSGEKKALVISATGTGKTILAALDVRAFRPRRMLFVVHREQILDRAIEEFTAVLGLAPEDIGKYVGSCREIDRRYVFATPQSLGSGGALEGIDKKHFDYILVDEVHRAGAQLHLNILNHFTPDFLLGITATPERTDDFNVFALFDFNVAYEIRLQRALKEEMLTPFHYYGISDFEIDGEVISDTSQLTSLVSPERVGHVVGAIERYGHVGTQVKGLIFCSRNDEAKQLSAMLNSASVHGHQLRTRALSGADSIGEREQAVVDLEAGRLDYLVTVDIFNEGIDIRSINQVIMLRQTKSSIVFTQQLGRGLRKSPGKDYLVVIDFIGNYANNFLVPIALFGDSSLNKDSIRRQMIEAQDVGEVAGLSSINFDAVSKERIFTALDATKLDSIRNLKKAFNDLQARIGSTPTLWDFARFDVADPVVVAGAKDNYWNLLTTFKVADSGPNKRENEVLTYVSREFLGGKRPHELLMLRRLLDEPEHRMSISTFVDMLVEEGLSHDAETISSLRRIADLSFFTEVERKRYGTALIEWTDEEIALAPDISRKIDVGGALLDQLSDVINTGLYLARHRYTWESDLEIGKKYSRKDVCRLLNWESNQQGTMYGYKVDSYSSTCPIFVTYHKHDDVSASTSYEDSFLNESVLRWFTRSNRTLKSKEVDAIAKNEIPLYLFAKKDDAEGTDFYFLGTATSANARQTTMPGSEGKELNVVTMDLHLDVPVEAGLYDYIVTSGAEHPVVDPGDAATYIEAPAQAQLSLDIGAESDEA